MYIYSKKPKQKLLGFSWVYCKSSANYFTLQAIKQTWKRTHPKLKNMTINAQFHSLWSFLQQFSKKFPICTLSDFYWLGKEQGRQQTHTSKRIESRMDPALIQVTTSTKAGIWAIWHMPWPSPCPAASPSPSKHNQQGKLGRSGFPTLTSSSSPNLYLRKESRKQYERLKTQWN